MRCPRGVAFRPGLIPALAFFTFIIGPPFGPAPNLGRADTVTLKNGLVYRGTVDRDNTMIFIHDGLKRIMVRESKIAQTQADAAFKGQELFQLVQPLKTLAGAMPEMVIGVDAGPWNDRGRREFGYVVDPRSRKRLRMEQAIIEMGPHLVRYRGIDGFWQGQAALSTVPRDVILGLLAKVERTNANERQRIGRFLVQAQWYAEALAELESWERDLPELKERAETVGKTVRDLLAGQKLEEVRRALNSRQPRAAHAILRAIDVTDLPVERAGEISKELGALDDLASADTALAEEVRQLAEALPEDERDAWSSLRAEILKAMAEAPDAVRDRLGAFAKAREDTKLDDSARLALVFTGWLAGPEAAVPDLKVASAYLKARNSVDKYLRGALPAERQSALNALNAMDIPAAEGKAARRVDCDLVTRLVRMMAPPWHSDAETAPPEGKGPAANVRTYRVQDDGNPTPTDYLAALPPEYHPLRAYPMLVVLHDGRGPRPTLDLWTAEAARHGFVVIAPQYLVPSLPPDYRYTPSEHAAVILAIRDALKRFAVDADRVFLAGQINGGHMAWDFGLAHPDLFAGVAPIAGLPARFVQAYRNNAKYVPVYDVVGSMTPGVEEVVLPFTRALLTRAYDITHVDYYQRGPEAFPEEAGPILDWMEIRSRTPHPDEFKVVTARTSDDRFFGVVAREFVPGVTPAPESVDPLGRGLKPAEIAYETSKPSNLLRVVTKGIRKLDIWVGPTTLDFSKRLEVRVNSRTMFRNIPKPDIEPMLEDLRIRGDRRQVYWLKVSAG